jgi:hypothetical protein
LYRFDVISAFVIAENGRKTISAARGRVRPEVKSPFDSLTPIWYRSALEFFQLSFTCQKLFDFFDLHVKCPLKFLGKGYSPVKKFFIDETPKGPSLGQSASFEISCVQIGSVVWSVGPVTKKR